MSMLRDRFLSQGFLLWPVPVLGKEMIHKLHLSMECMFGGKFSTGILPDEWHWREGISRPDAVREICNGWKSDHNVASVVLSENVGSIACALAGWNSARVGQDSLVWKPPQAGGVGPHRDRGYIGDMFRKKNSISEVYDWRKPRSLTIWIALDDADSENGVVEYVPGSHQNMTTSSASGELTQGFFQDSQLSDVEVVKMEVPQGWAVIHHEDTLHASKPNQSKTRNRRALAIHPIDGDLEFIDNPTYIYGRYKLKDSREVREEFFPLIYNQKESKWPWAFPPP